MRTTYANLTRVLHDKVRIRTSPAPAVRSIFNLFVQSAGSSPNSYFLYPRSKGLTERALADLGYAETFIFRPGALIRDDPRFVERLLVYVLSKCNPLLQPWFSDAAMTDQC